MNLEVITEQDNNLQDNTYQNLEKQQDFAAQLQNTKALGIDFHQGLGMFKAFEFMSKMSNVLQTKWLMERKESGDYKGLQVFINNEPVILNDFNRLCQYVGIAKSKAFEDIQNLKVLGEAFMQKSESIGLGQKALRKLRYLDEDSREQIFQEEKNSNDPEILKELIEQYVDEKSKIQKEKEALSEDYEAQKKVTAKTREKLDKAERELEKLTALPEKAHLAKRKELRQALALELGRECENYLGALPKVLGIANKIIDSAYADEDKEVIALVTEKVSQMCGLMSRLIYESGIDIDFSILLQTQEDIEDIIEA